MHLQTSKQKFESGFATVLPVLVVMVLVVVAGYAGYRVMSAQPTATTTANSTKSVTLQPVTFVGQSAANGQPLSTSTSTTTSGQGTGSSSGSSSTTGNSSSTTSASSGTTTSIISGINGHITLTTGCTPPRMCATFIRSYQATVDVDSAAGTAVTSFTSDTQGNFSVVLEPGTYTLVPQSYGSGQITAPTQQVTVKANQYTSTNIAYKHML